MVIYRTSWFTVARLFTDLNQLVTGDVFMVNVLDKIFTYEVEEILIVLPKEVDKLAIVPKKDYVTLMTCTPYGINTQTAYSGTPNRNDLCKNGFSVGRCNSA